MIYPSTYVQDASFTTIMASGAGVGAGLHFAGASREKTAFGATVFMLGQYIALALNMVCEQKDDGTLKKGAYRCNTLPGQAMLGNFAMTRDTLSGTVFMAMGMYWADTNWAEILAGAGGGYAGATAIQLWWNREGA